MIIMPQFYFGSLLASINNYWRYYDSKIQKTCEYSWPHLSVQHQWLALTLINHKTFMTRVLWCLLLQCIRELAGCSLVRLEILVGIGAHSKGLFIGRKMQILLVGGNPNNVSYWRQISPPLHNQIIVIWAFCSP